jgi:cytochrome c553
MMRFVFALLVLVSVSPARAETPQQILDSLVAQAGPASAARGEQLFRAKFTSGKTADSCMSCHTDNPKAAGQHVKTHKTIDAIAPVAQKDRFTDPAKVEKWFKRNCNEVLARACTPQEKADFTAYMISVK